ncbi:hypothetical protein M431DRAFT_481831 [Trichoderma harzianum CBS 226.95]|uniref:Uncharacterized protein n=1 Tax=Trichoderma harzianum CBS 226.95 TaxID=983964 RepID=A0A2T4ACF8_TRIHA|nr:hypothetical protein M431DRAFT_481831 [Trichoderma harzianum CBS 226.95]PTB54618.1 hypothetical protein M431DRAFT_481831 [Trichoderma harzianum CBS 226.95]
MAAIDVETFTTGQIGLWNGTQDGKDGIVDYKKGKQAPRRISCQGAGLLEGRSDQPGPRPVAHVDRDLPNAIVSLQCALGKDKADNLLKRHKRWAQVNLWRPIGRPVVKWPLVFANHDAIPDWDYDTHMARVYSVNDPRIADRGGKSHNCILIDDERYAYHYASNVAPDEALVFFSFHSDPKMVLPHGAFWDNKTPDDAPPRRSLEVRCFVFFDDDVV